MTTRNLVALILSFILYVLLQVLLVKHMVLFDYAFCFVYIAVVLLMPFDTSLTTLLWVGFGTGLFVDVFYDTLGMNAAALTLVAYLRQYVIRLLMPQRGYEDRMKLSLRSMGLRWFFAYTVLLTFVHHTLLFFLEASNFDLFFFTLLKVLASTLYTTLVVVSAQYLRRD